MQALHLLGQEPGRLHRGLFAIVEVAGQKKRVDLLVDAQIDDPHESPPRGIADQRGELGIAQGERAERRIEVDVGGVDEAIGHAGAVIFVSEPCWPTLYCNRGPGATSHPREWDVVPCLMVRRLTLWP